ncbi:MAG: hypothetical protein AAF802_32605 [Planctomycetota bacterium]
MLVLTAGASLAFCFCRASGPSYGPVWVDIAAKSYIVALTLTWTLTLLIAFDSSPFRHVARCSGKSCLLSISVASIFRLMTDWYLLLPRTSHGVVVRSKSNSLFDRLVGVLFDFDNFTPAMATVVTWVFLSMRATPAGWWPSSNWISRSGFAIGLFWIAYALVNGLIIVLSYETRSLIL